MTDTVVETENDVMQPEIPDAYVVPVEAMNAIVGYLLSQPWREVDHLLRPINGIRTFDEYVGT